MQGISITLVNTLKGKEQVQEVVKVVNRRHKGKTLKKKKGNWSSSKDSLDRVYSIVDC